MAEYFLPDVTKLKELDCGYELRVLKKQDFADLYLELIDFQLSFTNMIINLFQFNMTKK